MKKSYSKELDRLKQEYDSKAKKGLEKPDVVSGILDTLEVELLHNGKINWIWVVLNLGKIIAKVVFAIRNR